jgi:hypothetical protein
LLICAKDLFVGAKLGWPAKLRHREPVFIAQPFEQAMLQSMKVGGDLYERFADDLDRQ